jgi:EpsI family protein
MAFFLQSTTSKILTLALVAQSATFYAFSRTELAPKPRALEKFTLQSPDWTAIEDVQLDADTLEVLKADDILSRIYRERNTGDSADLFVAYFQTQRNGKAPHSPKNCLPGSGWAPSKAGTVDLAIQGESEPIRINRYIVARGSNQSVVLYWYQSKNRVVASEYSAKLYTMLDAVRYNRTDTALIRVVTAVSNGDTTSAERTAMKFVETVFEPLKAYLPS